MSNDYVVCSRWHSGHSFHWKGSNGAVDISDLGKDPFCVIYHDKGDRGFGIRGKFRYIVFELIEVDRDPDGNIIAWNLKSITETGFTVTVFND